MNDNFNQILYYEHEQESEYTNPKESGLRSGKGNGFFRKLLIGE